MRKLIFILLLSGFLLAVASAPAGAATLTAMDSKATPSSIVNVTFPDTAQGEADAITWMKNHTPQAKGYFKRSGSYIFVILKDHRVNYKQTSSWRGRGYKWLQYDPEPVYISGSIQYTFNRMPNYPDLVEDSVYGPATETDTKQFQRNWALTQDGIMGTNTYWLFCQSPI